VDKIGTGVALRAPHSGTWSCPTRRTLCERLRSVRKDAAAEFQRILDRPGNVLNSTLASLAHLGLGQALGVAGKKEKVRTAYQDFLQFRKDADPDIPILKQAKAEYAKLQ